MEKKTIDKKKRKVISVEINEEMQKLLDERIKYLQARRPGTKVTVSDAVRHALSYVGYKRGKKCQGEE